MAADLGFEATELRLGLPGGYEGEARSSSDKTGFAEAIDLKLKVEPAGEEAPATEDRTNVAVVAAVAAQEEHEKAAADACVGNMKRSPSQSSVITTAVLPDPAEKPRAQVCARREAGGDPGHGLRPQGERCEQPRPLHADHCPWMLSGGP
ncbi:hypothetical protein ZWY2020_057498 [Hordeum vulgare]|nr:hypothetical protein ZWY2020_057495 [Hordeum vulgare]KAI4999038.1 hypothetical protein ZWY2020_057498 [Hordeum vulgare]